MNPNDIATKQDINQLHDKLSLLLEEIAKIKSPVENPAQEKYLTSREVSETYKISKSHLTDLRTEGKIPYSKPFGVLLYPKSEIEKIIKNNWRGIIIDN
ncbi:MAG: helix-turn-helix domain-containing protein [Bacteroidetes bacterium]|nr:helix-turn-helix domain-containing protein [Bacteroidota bacterium]